MYTSTDEEIVEYLLDCLIRGNGFLIEDANISRYKKEIEEIESDHSLSVNEKIKKKKRCQNFIKDQSRMRSKKSESLKEISTLLNEYIRCANEYRIDGNTVNSSYSVEEPTQQIFCESVLSAAIICLDKRRSLVSLRDKSYHNDEYKVQKRMEKLKKQIFDKINKSDVRFLFDDHGVELPLALKDLKNFKHFLDVLDQAIEKQGIIRYYSNQIITLPNTDITVDIDEFFHSFNPKEYCASLISKINHIDEMLKRKSSNTLVDIRNMYKEYAVRFISYKLIEYYIKNGDLKNHAKAIERLKNLVEKEAKKCEQMKRKADEKLATYQKINKMVDVAYNMNPKLRAEINENLKMDQEPVGVNSVDINSNDIENSIDLENREEVPSFEYDIVDKKENKPEKDNFIECNKKTENELKSLSSGYRVRYIRERLAKPELGKMDYLDFLKATCPEEQELINYVENQQKKAETIYKEYMIDRAKRIANNQPIISFTRFVEIMYKMDYNDVNIELPSQIEEDLKGMKAL